MCKIIKAKQFRVILVLVIAFSFLFISIYKAEVASGEYAIKVGDSFDFNVPRLHDKDGSKILFNLGGVLIQEGCTIKISFLRVEPPLIQYKLTSNLGNGEAKLTILANIFVQDREWDTLSAYYEAEGFIVFEDDQIWRMRDNRSGDLDVSFNKKDGVLTNFYSYNYSLIVDQINLFEVEFVRYGYGSGNLWMISFVFLVPIIGTIIGYSLKAAGKGMKVE
ncbi:MAG: hypothetical protein ACTSXA_15015 [Candidatus Heimdallarchaeota archaeon]